ncbi:phage portal protein [Pragia fontium]|uniref:Phage portal protein, PBSX family n=1 Tax=Pragia fontium DSM 5563 = ATCC 49100 TaxID=1122977 RepID=A0AAJ4W9K4_9GAMM|nr:phage portal protein [Pragia fontium]SFC49306.1 phage portal protein, PBSX family [Pragia fontium DSM 5563 = ATCC 49100]
MKKRHHRRGKVSATVNNKHMSVINFGKPEPVLTTGTDYENIRYDGDNDHYTLPINRLALAQLVNLNSQHGGIIYHRKNMLLSDYIDGGLSHEEIEAVCFDFLIFGDVAIVKVRNGYGQVIGLAPLPSLYLRRRKNGNFLVLQDDEPLEYSPDDIIYIKQYDPQQPIYGLPDYISGIHAALLNSEATLFRRKYYHNGAHMGFILYANDPNMTDEIEEEIKRKIQDSQGVGNFRNLFVNIPNGEPDGIKIMPVGDVSAKDEFANVKNISGQDVFTAHRFPAGLGGLIPGPGVTLPDPEKSRNTYRKDEIIPIQKRLINAINQDKEIAAISSLQVNFDIDENIPKAA